MVHKRRLAEYTLNIHSESFGVLHMCVGGGGGWGPFLLFKHITT